MSAIKAFIKKLAVALLLITCTNSISWANSTTLNKQPLAGLIINQTHSYVAQNFYQAFCLSWYEHKEAANHNITVKEVHSPRFGRQVQILFNHQVAHTVALPSGKLDMNGLAVNAANASIGRVVQMAFNSITFSNPDLAQDEI